MITIRQNLKKPKRTRRSLSLSENQDQILQFINERNPPLDNSNNSSERLIESKNINQSGSESESESNEDKVKELVNFGNAMLEKKREDQKTIEKLKEKLKKKKLKMKLLKNNTVNLNNQIRELERSDRYTKKSVTSKDEIIKEYRNQLDKSENENFKFRKVLVDLMNQQRNMGGQYKGETEIGTDLEIQTEELLKQIEELKANLQKSWKRWEDLVCKKNNESQKIKKYYKLKEELKTKEKQIDQLTKQSKNLTNIEYDYFKIEQIKTEEKIKGLTLEAQYQDQKINNLTKNEQALLQEINNLNQLLTDNARKKIEKYPQSQSVSNELVVLEKDQTINRLSRELNKLALESENKYNNLEKKLKLERKKIKRRDKNLQSYYKKLIEYRQNYDRLKIIVYQYKFGKKYFKKKVEELMKQIQDIVMNEDNEIENEIDKKKNNNEKITNRKLKKNNKEK
ncbi:hypothetical protein M0813_01913 [Anaeramoeba flamelloides]|uniref:Uncharacterized protein n=1 Tax=Anaeramoeba flamelloides TaxID=1746091 RepID=A0ABQ8YPX6_9EUKA|nr:hypothetical protein M0813_01913 [Anaeramoeba flamelloides]